MSEWFQFKGIKSDIYPELIVQDLPAITRARMRTEDYYIDGKDGMQTSDLGYESYTKSCKIGLKNFDNLDKIINWLDGSGELTFSNEPDKVYKAKIVGQIDYTELGIFKESIVTWLVYPWKFLKNEPAIALPNGVTVSVYNMGFRQSYPLIEIDTTTIASVYIDGISVGTIQGIQGKISLDSEEGGFSYNTNTGAILSGAYSGTYPILKPGVNSISVVGTGLVSAKIYPRSRFL